VFDDVTTATVVTKSRDSRHKLLSHHFLRSNRYNIFSKENFLKL